MTNEDRQPDQYPVRLESPSGLAVQVNANGSIRRMDYRDIMLNLFLGNELEGGPANLYLRRLGESVEAIPLLGPRSPAEVRCDSQGLTLTGTWQGIRFTVSLALAETAPAWFWHVALENTGDHAATLDLIYAQDLGLAHYGAVRLNEYYVSQYLDHTPLAHPELGWVLASRQNQSMGGRNPWCLIGSLGEGVSYATDALQVHGLETPSRRDAGGPYPQGWGVSRRCLEQAPGGRGPAGPAPPARAWDGRHPGRAGAAPSRADGRCGDSLAGSRPIIPRRPRRPTWPGSSGRSPCRRPMPVQAADAGEWRSAAASLFSTAPLLEARDLTAAGIAALFGTRLREVEREDGRPLSFFVGERSHVALKAKELKVLRPHGQILRTGGGLTPDEAALTSTCWMAGVFHSMVTQGHVSINRFLSTTHGYLGLFRSHGQRLFVEIDGGWQLLDVPSAFEMSPQGCRWYYRHAGGLIRVESLAPTDRHELLLSVEVLEGGPLRFLLSNHVAINGDDGSDPVPVRYEQDDQGFFIRPIPECDVGRRFPEGGFRLDPLPGTRIERFGGDELLFADGRSRGQPFLCLMTGPARSMGFRMTGHLVPEPEAALHAGAGATGARSRLGCASTRPSAVPWPRRRRGLPRSCPGWPTMRWCIT